MKKHYDFSGARKNPYAKRLKKQVTIRLDDATLAYFRGLSDETGIGYQTLINLYLQGRLPSEKFVSERIGLGDIEDAFHKMHAGEVLRSVVVLK